MDSEPHSKEVNAARLITPELIKIMEEKANKMGAQMFEVYSREKMLK